MAETPPTPPSAPTPEPAAPSRGADLRGATRLATDATAGLANLVEAMHERIARLQDEIEVDRKKVEDLNGLPAGGRYQCLYGNGWMVPGGTGSSVTVTGQGGLGVGVNGSVVVSNTVVVPNAGVAVAPCVYTLNPEFERAKERLELNRKALARAKTELAELDRRASFEGVPREWRR